MEGTPPEKDGGQKRRRTVKRIFGWLLFQSLGAWLRHLLDS